MDESKNQFIKCKSCKKNVKTIVNAKIIDSTLQDDGTYKMRTRVEFDMCLDCIRKVIKQIDPL
jgi:hypothetical protein